MEALLASDSPTGSILDNPLLKPAAPSRPANLEGRLIGPYRMLREIGRGGMGVVYLAERADQAFRRLVAIKVLQTGLGAAEMLARFEQEREILASLDHPHIARLLDGGATPDGLSYLVMEYVEGHAIDKYCDEQKLDIPARLNLFRTVCSAVEYAHQRRIIHRDLKPANILVTADGTVKLLDFGIAKLMPGRDAESAALVTRTGMCLMTPEYASPEQIRGEAVGAATDVYALGVVLYELLTGQRPYRLRSRIFHEIVRAICDEPPTRPSTSFPEAGDAVTDVTESVEHISRVRRTSPADLRRSLAGDLDGIVLKALEKQPFDRYRSASSLSSDIEQHLEGRPVVARQATLAYRGGKFMQRNLPWMILVLAIAAALASGGISINRTGAAVIGGCVAAAGLWYAATNREVGRRIAESESLYVRAMSDRRTFFIWLFGSFFLSIIWPPLGAVSLVLLALLLRQAVGWLGRNRSSGGLLLDLSTSRQIQIWTPTFLIYMVIASLGRLIINLVSLPLDLPGQILDQNGMFITYFCVWVLCMGLYLFLEQRLEIRARGVMIAGSLYPWERIESQEWSIDPAVHYFAKKWNLQDPSINEAELREAIPRYDKLAEFFSDYPMLRLHLRGGIQFLPPVQVGILLGRRAEVEAVISRYLSEWPAAVNPIEEMTE